MPGRKKRTLPKLCTHKASGLDYVWLDGKRHYLGKTDDPKTIAKYHRAIAEYLAVGSAPTGKASVTTVADLFDRYLVSMKQEWFGSDGKPAERLLQQEEPLLRRLSANYGDLAANDFGPMALIAIRKGMIAKEWKRSTINDRIKIIQKVFRVGVSLQLVNTSTYEALRTVRGLTKRQVSSAQESQKVKAAPKRHIDKIIPLVSPQVAAMMLIQFYSAARAGEVIIMRPQNIDRSLKVWRFRPTNHKTDRHDSREDVKEVYLGPESQKILDPFLLNRPADAFIFSPFEAAVEMRCRRTVNRKTPISYGNRPGKGSKKNPKCRPGEKYTTGSYRKAIRRACEKAGIPIFTPHQIRHTAATRIEGAIGKQASSAMCGHKDPRQNERYIKRKEVEREALKAAEHLG